MKDIMRAQLRQYLKRSVGYLLLLLLIGTYLLLMIFQGGLNGDEPKKMSDFLPEVMPFLGGGALMASIITAGLCAGADFADKTINYELSGGRTRAAVMFGRVIPALALGMLCAALVYAVPVTVYTLLFGWGDAFSVTDVLPRFVLALCPCLRVSCFFIFIVFVTKSAMTCMTGCIVGMTAAVPGTEIPLLGALYKNTYALGTGNLQMLMTVDSWYTYDLRLNVHMIYYPALSASAVLLTVTVSLAVSAVYLLLCWHFFHVDDMN